MWKTYLTYQNFIYSLNKEDYSFSSFNIISGIDYPDISKIPAQIFIGYSYQNIDFFNNIKSDFIYLDTKLISQLGNRTSVSYGAFIENYLTTSNGSITSDSRESKGWYYGPQFSLNLLQNFLINIGYKFLLLSSSDLEFPSYEHRINAVGGFRISDRVSLFLHIDFYLRQAKFNGFEDDMPTLLPTKNENHITLKSNYKLGKGFSVYMKTGYFRENLFAEGKNIDGLNLLLGIEFRN